MSFFVREPKLAQEAPNRIGVRLNASCIMKGGGKLGHRHVAVLLYDFDKKRLMSGKFAVPPGATLRGGASGSGPADRKAPPRPCRR